MKKTGIMILTAALLTLCLACSAAQSASSATPSRNQSTSSTEPQTAQEATVSAPVNPLLNNASSDETGYFMAVSGLETGEASRYLYFNTETSGDRLAYVMVTGPGSVTWEKRELTFTYSYSDSSVTLNYSDGTTDILSILESGDELIDSSANIIYERFDPEALKAANAAADEGKYQEVELSTPIVLIDNEVGSATITAKYIDARSSITEVGYKVTFVNKTSDQYIIFLTNDVSVNGVMANGFFTGDMVSPGKVSYGSYSWQVWEEQQAVKDLDGLKNVEGRIRICSNTDGSSAYMTFCGDNLFSIK